MARKKLTLTRGLLAAALISPVYAGEFCAVSDFGNKGQCFLTMSSCRQWVASSGGTCVYSESSSAAATKSTSPTFVGPSKWCKYSPEVGFLKNTAICAYDQKSECAGKIVARGEICLLNPKFDSDPTEEAPPRNVTSAPSVNRSNWIFYFGDDKADNYLSRDSIFRYGDRVDVQITANFKSDSSVKSLVVDMTIDCAKQEHTVRRAVGTSSQYGEGSVVHDLQPSVDRDKKKGPTPLKPGSSMAELYPRVCDVPK